MGVADILSGTPAVEASSGAFHVSAEWFASWDAAYLDAAQRAVSIYGLELLDETARLGPIRKRIGRRTIMNLLGPIANPAGVTRQLIGVARPDYLPVYAGALDRIGC